MRQKNQDLKLKLKKIATWKNSAYLLILVLSTSLSGFYAGSKKNEIKNPEIIIDTNEIDCGCSFNEEDTSLSEEKKYISSKSSKYFYPSDCSYASRIKEENRIVYNTQEQAKNEGKTFYSKCE